MVVDDLLGARWLWYTELLHRLHNANSEGERHSLLTLAQAAKPIGRSLYDGEVRVRIGDALTDLRERADCVESSSGKTDRDCVGDPIADLDTLVFDISGCIITPWNSVVLDGVIYPDEFRTMSHNWRKFGWAAAPIERIGFYDFDITSETCVVNTGQAVTADEEQIYFLFNSYQSLGNFGHFVHDTLCQLKAYNYICDKLGRRLVPILVSDFSFPMQHLLFEELVAPKSLRLYTKAAPHRVKRCYTANLTMNSQKGAISIASFTYLRERLQEVALRRRSSLALDSTKIYLSRNDTKKSDGRTFHNIVEAELLISSHGYKSVTVGEYNIEDVLAIFSNVERVVGVHGAGMVNPLFSALDPHIIEMWGYPRSWRSIVMISWACGLWHRVVRADETKSETSSPATRLEELEAALRENSTA